MSLQNGICPCCQIVGPMLTLSCSTVHFPKHAFPGKYTTLRLVYPRIKGFNSSTLLVFSSCFGCGFFVPYLPSVSGFLAVSAVDSICFVTSMQRVHSSLSSSARSDLAERCRVFPTTASVVVGDSPSTAIPRVCLLREVRGGPVSRRDRG